MTIMIGIRGSYDPNLWNTNLSRFGLTVAHWQTNRLMRALVSQTLTELTDIYDAQFAALHRMAGTK